MQGRRHGGRPVTIDAMLGGNCKLVEILHGYESKTRECQ